LIRDFSQYVEQRNPKTHELPRHLVKIRAGNDEMVHYFQKEEDLARFSAENPDLGLFGREEPEGGAVEKGRNGHARRAQHVELHESKAVAELLDRLSRKGLSVDHYSAQDKPLFELVEGEGEKAQTKPLFSIPEILAGVKEGLLEEFDRYSKEKVYASGLEMLEGIVSFYFYIAGLKAEWFLLLDRHHPYKLADTHPVCREHLEAIYNCLVDIFEQAVRRGREDGSMGPLNPRKAALILFSMVDGIVRFKNKNLYDAGSLYTEVLALCRRMVIPHEADESRA